MVSSTFHSDLCGSDSVFRLYSSRFCRSAPVALLIGLLLSIAPAQAQIIQVPNQQPTIQAAINAASPGGTVLVAPGTYVENINFLGKAIKVTSVSGPAVTIIDGNQADSVVTFASGEGLGSEVSGFTIRNGKATGQPNFGGGGVRISGSSPTVQGNVITDNQACGGGGVASDFGSPVVQMNTISHNTQGGCISGNGGGGIRVGGNSNAQILNNVITENTIGSDGGGISLFAAGTPIIRGNFISKNTSIGCGGGISLVNQSDAVIVGNVITGNTAACGGGISSSVPFSGKGPLLMNNTVADNNAPVGSGINTDGFDAQSELINNIVIGKAQQTAISCGALNDNIMPILRFNNVMNPQAPAYAVSCTNQTGLNGNISADPLFVAPTQGNYRLNPDSPSIDTGDNAAPSLPPTDITGAGRIVDGDGNGSAVVDMGAYEFGPNPGTLQFSAAGYSGVENSGQKQISVTRLGGKTGQVSVDYAVVGGTATPASDFSLAPGTLAFSNGDMAAKTIAVSIFDDALPEPSETVALALTNPTGGASLGPQSSTVLTIIDDELVADLAVTMTDNPDPVFANGHIIYTIKITNNGPFPATGVMLNDPLPSAVGSVMVTASQGSCSGSGTVTCSLGTLAVGSTATVTIDVVVFLKGTIVNTATVAGTEPDLIPANNSVTQSTSAALTLFSGPYFPLTAGMGWTYLKNGVTNSVVSILPGTVSVNGVATTVLAYSDSGRQEFYTNDANGIRQHRQFEPNVPTEVGPLDITITFTPPIKLANVQAILGQSVFSSGIAQSNPLPVVGVLTLPYSTTLQVIGLESVTVPGGTFDALRLQASLTINGEMSTETTYLAQGIGIVKSIDSDDTEVLTGFSAPLSVIKSGDGNGMVVSSPVGIACGGTCQASFNGGTTVTLTATPANGYAFAGWTSGGCSGTGACQVTMNASKAVTAQFRAVPVKRSPPRFIRP